MNETLQYVLMLTCYIFIHIFKFNICTHWCIMNQQWPLQLKSLFCVLLHMCQTLSSSAFVSSPIYGPSCFPVIISSVSVSRVSWLCLPIYSLFCPMLPVDYCYCHMCQTRVDVRSCVSSICYSLNTPFVTILVPGSPCAALWQWTTKPVIRDHFWKLRFTLHLKLIG